MPGIYRYKKQKPLIGDRVRISKNEGNEWQIQEILGRNNSFIRPPVANVDLAVLVFSVDLPSINLQLLDKMLISCEYKNLETIICFSKITLSDPSRVEFYKYLYSDIGYNVFSIDVLDNDVDMRFKELLDNKTFFLAGPSGVGKSTLTNWLKKEKVMDIGEISSKNKRGKHTTRHVEMIKLWENTYIIDTPGFSNIDVPENISVNELRKYFPEFQNEKCKYSSCLHINEPSCRIKNDVKSGRIQESRYENYKYMLNKIMKGNKY
jgi:ribosome biogenesis GTPase